MPDFYFIGEEELLMALRLVGVGGVAVTGREEALEAFAAATAQPALAPARPGQPPHPAEAAREAKVLILSSGVAASLEEEARAWQFRGDYPLIVEIPSPGAGADGGASLLKAIREAVGINI